jgi:hypothetical protein
MSIKSAAFLALIGTLVLSVLLTADLINAILGVARGLIPSMALLRMLVYWFAGVTVTIFFFAFRRAQA